MHANSLVAGETLSNDQVAEAHSKSPTSPSANMGAHWRDFAFVGAEATVADSRTPHHEARIAPVNNRNKLLIKSTY
jgi:hypothetical protein